MSFFRSDQTNSPLNDLLSRWEAAIPNSVASSSDDSSTASTPPVPSSTASKPSSTDTPSPEPPTLDQFLAEEDTPRELRSENKRLIAYIAHPHTLGQLMHRAFIVPAQIAAVAPNFEPRPIPGSLSTGFAKPDPQLDDTDRQFNLAYIASELLATDNKIIADSILDHDDILATAFAVVEETDRGKLDTVLAIHFSKLLISLLKSHNARAIEHLAERGPKFINGILKHMDCGPIADLVVRMLEGPDTEQSAYSANCKKRPAGQALDLLSNADILGGLAECFVRASNDTPETAEGPADDATFAPEDDTHDTAQSSYERQGRQRRLREETMSNVTSTILGLAERLLQLPDLNCTIPPKLSPYHNPVVVSRLLDAGLYASCNGKTEKELSDEAKVMASSEERVEAFSLRSNSALLHSLGLAANLMTTRANVVRDEDEPFTPCVRGIPGRPLYSGHGIGPGGTANKNMDRPKLPPPDDATEEELKLLTDHTKKKPGDAIVETASLEADLAIRFSRLSEMFGNGDELDGNGTLRPLGSLRLKLAEFFTACMKKATQDTVQQISDLGVPKKLLELFSKYQWSSMLHGVITKSVSAAFSGDEDGRPSRSAWFAAGLIPWLIASWSKNAKQGNESIRTRAGYMGHLIRIGTSLMAYIEESKEETNAELPNEDDLEAFKVFADQILGPAHNRESMPLCGDLNDADEDEGEEATDVLEMGGMSFVENPTNSTPDVPMQFGYSKSSDNDSEDEDEIKPVDVDDLDHFGADDDDVQEVKPLVDHDIPLALREQLSRAEDSETIKQVAVEALAQPSRIPTIPTSETNDLRSRTQAVEQNSIPMDDLSGVIDSVDSSSEDEGSYVAFVDDQKEEETAQVLSGVGNLRISESGAGTSLDGIVTEIEEPDPILPTNDTGEHLQSLADNIITAPDDAENSSDEEYEAWEDPARVSTSTNAALGVGSKAEEVEKPESDRPKSVA